MQVAPASAAPEAGNASPAGLNYRFLWSQNPPDSCLCHTGASYPDTVIRREKAQKQSKKKKTNKPIPKQDLSSSTSAQRNTDFLLILRVRPCKTWWLQGVIPSLCPGSGGSTSMHTHSPILGKFFSAPLDLGGCFPPLEVLLSLLSFPST